MRAPHADRPEGVPTAQETNRLEAFSDGVFAIAITLLVLEIKVPHLEASEEGRRLLGALLNQWPAFAAFITSFATILIMWINHHTLFTLIRRSDRGLVLVNGLLLLCITFVPFPTALLAEYFQHEGEHVAAAVYSGTFVVIALVFNLLWWYAVRHGKLWAPHVTPSQVAGITRQYAFGPALYLVALGLAFVHVGLSLAICFGLAIFFALPPAVVRRPRRR